MAVNGYWDEEGIFHAQAPKQFTFSPQARAAALAKREANKKGDQEDERPGVQIGKKDGLSLHEATKVRKSLVDAGYKKIDQGAERGVTWTTHEHPETGHRVVVRASYMDSKREAKPTDTEPNYIVPRNERKFDVRDSRPGDAVHAHPMTA